MKITLQRAYHWLLSIASAHGTCCVTLQRRAWATWHGVQAEGSVPCNAAATVLPMVCVQGDEDTIGIGHINGCSSPPVYMGRYPALKGRHPQLSDMSDQSWGNDHALDFAAGKALTIDESHAMKWGCVLVVGMQLHQHAIV